MYEKLLSGDIRLDTATGARRLSQSAYFELWQSLKDRPEYGFVDPSLAQEENGGCAVCGEFLINVPGVAGTCELCEVSKRTEILRVAQNREWYQQEMDETLPAEKMEGRLNDPLLLAVQAGMHCPNDHCL